MCFSSDPDLVVVEKARALIRLNALPQNASALLVWESVMRVMGAEKI